MLQIHSKKRKLDDDEIDEEEDDELDEDEDEIDSEEEEDLQVRSRRCQYFLPQKLTYNAPIF